MRVLAADNCRNARLSGVADRRMGHVRAKEDDRLIENLYKVSDQR